MRAQSLRAPSLPRALVLGALGGVALILVSVFSRRGPLIFIPYAVLLATLAALVARRELAFTTRFVAVFAGFTVASLALYGYVTLFGAESASSIPVLGHAWRLGLVLGIGAILAAAVGYVTGWPKNDSEAAAHGDSSATT